VEEREERAQRGRTGAPLNLGGIIGIRLQPPGARGKGATQGQPTTTCLVPTEGDFRNGGTDSTLISPLTRCGMKRHTMDGNADAIGFAKP